MACWWASPHCDERRCHRRRCEHGHRQAHVAVGERLGDEHVRSPWSVRCRNRRGPRGSPTAVRPSSAPRAPAVRRRSGRRRRPRRGGPQLFGGELGTVSTIICCSSVGVRSNNPVSDVGASRAGLPSRVVALNVRCAAPATRKPCRVAVATTFSTGLRSPVRSSSGLPASRLSAARPKPMASRRVAFCRATAFPPVYLLASRLAGSRARTPGGSTRFHAESGDVIG